MWWYRVRKTSRPVMHCCCGPGARQRATLESRSKTFPPPGVMAKHSSPSSTETGGCLLYSLCVRTHVHMRASICMYLFLFDACLSVSPYIQC